MRIPEESGQRFQSYPTKHSDLIRPSIPKLSDQNWGSIGMAGRIDRNRCPEWPEQCPGAEKRGSLRKDVVSSPFHMIKGKNDVQKAITYAKNQRSPSNALSRWVC